MRKLRWSQQGPQKVGTQPRHYKAHNPDGYDPRIQKYYFCKVFAKFRFHEDK